MSAATLDALAAWLTAELGEAQPVKRSGPPAVTRLALALEPADVPPVVAADAVFLHRSRHVGGRWPGVGVLGAHDGFDRHLTTGPNVRLARALGWRDVQVVEWEGGVAGVIATPPQATWTAVRDALLAEFGGEDSHVAPPAPDGPPGRVAVMNAMRPAVVERAAAAGVGTFVTGQLRPSAVPAARARGVGVVALGHRRTELWGLRTLACELAAAFPGLDVRVDGDAP